VILEAFSQVLQQRFGHTSRSPEHILHNWLYGILKQAEPKPPYPDGKTAPDDEVLQVHIARVLHQELSLSEIHGQIWFEAKTPSGQMLLESLYEYCKSFENWQFRRWLHEVQASDFSLIR
jgi:hypothetical protein